MFTLVWHVTSNTIQTSTIYSHAYIDLMISVCLVPLSLVNTRDSVSIAIRLETYILCFFLFQRNKLFTCFWKWNEKLLYRKSSKVFIISLNTLLEVAINFSMPLLCTCEHTPILNQILTCGNNIATCGNQILTCGDAIVTCGNQILTCGHQILSCGNKIKQERKTIYVPSWAP